MALGSNETTNGVVITVYVESDTTRSTKLHPYLTTQHSIDYDRRALLLAHSRHLRRNAPSPQKEKVPMPITKSKKGIWLSQPVRICSCFSSIQIRSQRAIERVASKETKERNQFHNKRKSPFLSKMKNTLKQLSCKEI